MTPPPPPVAFRDHDPDWVARAEAFIRANLPLVEVPGTGGLCLHRAGPRSGLARLVGDGPPPYWAHAWPGDQALAAHLLACPEALGPAGRRRPVVSFGSGAGLSALAARRAGAPAARLVDPDPLAAVAARLNFAANGFAGDASGFEEVIAPMPGPAGVAAAALILVGDLFYDRALAAEATARLDGLDAPVLVGDVGRRWLPRDRLVPLAAYPVRDVGDPPGAPPREGWVYRWAAP